MKSLNDGYDPSPDRERSWLDPDEIKAIIETDGRGFVKDPRAVMHFVRRTLLTFKGFQKSMNDMQGIIEDMNRNRKTGAASSLHPMESVRFLSDEQKQVIFDGLMMDKMALVERREKQAEERDRQLRGKEARLMLALDKINSDTSIPANVKDLLSRVLAPVAPVTEDSAEPVIIERDAPETVSEEGDLADLFGFGDE